jgi:hypothetical protein
MKTAIASNGTTDIADRPERSFAVDSDVISAAIALSNRLMIDSSQRTWAALATILRDVGRIGAAGEI